MMGRLGSGLPVLLPLSIRTLPLAEALILRLGIASSFLVDLLLMPKTYCMSAKYAMSELPAPLYQERREF